MSRHTLKIILFSFLILNASLACAIERPPSCDSKGLPPKRRAECHMEKVVNARSNPRINEVVKKFEDAGYLPFFISTWDYEQRCTAAHDCTFLTAMNFWKHEPGKVNRMIWFAANIVVPSNPEEEPRMEGGIIAPPGW